MQDFDPDYIKNIDLDIQNHIDKASEGESVLYIRYDQQYDQYSFGIAGNTKDIGQVFARLAQENEDFTKILMEYAKIYYKGGLG